MITLKDLIKLSISEKLTSRAIQRYVTCLYRYCSTCLKDAGHLLKMLLYTELTIIQLFKIGYSVLASDFLNNIYTVRL